MNIFISCTEKDHNIALQLYNDLKKIELTPWLESEDFLPGRHRENQIRQAIKQSRYILVLSSHSVSQKGIVQKELTIKQ